MDNNKIPVLKVGTPVTLTLPFTLIERIQATLAFIVDGKSKEELEAVKEHISLSTLSPWEASAITLTEFIQRIVKQAQEDGNIEYKDIKDIISAGLQ